MRGQKLILVKGVYSLEKWTKPNPLMSTENRPVDISSVQKLSIEPQIVDFGAAHKEFWFNLCE